MANPAGGHWALAATSQGPTSAFALPQLQKCLKSQPTRGASPRNKPPPSAASPYDPSPSSKRTGCGHLRSTLAPYFLATRFAMAFAAISLLDSRFLAFLAGALVAAGFAAGSFVGPLRLAMLRKVAS
jgi:hypothetical protein